jgi:hypothetical protein
MPLSKAQKLDSGSGKLPWVTQVDLNVRPEMSLPRHCITASALESLPPELFRNILDHLPAEARYCLASCNKTIMQTLGMNPRWLTNDLDVLDDKFAFLHQLIRHSPAWLCYRCKCVHHGRQMYPGLWQLDAVPGTNWNPLALGGTQPHNAIGLPYCDFDFCTRIEMKNERKVQQYTFLLTYGKDGEYEGSQSNLALDMSCATERFEDGRVLGHKTFTFWSQNGKWHSPYIQFSPDGVELGINLDLCKHLSLRRTQPDENIIADILQCGWIMASHTYHGDNCTNATCVGGYPAPKAHRMCLPGVGATMRHEGACKHCATEFVLEMSPHCGKEEKVLEIQVWHDLSPSELLSNKEGCRRN